MAGVQAGRRGKGNFRQFQAGQARAGRQFCRQGRQGQEGNFAGRAGKGRKGHFFAGQARARQGMGRPGRPAPAAWPAGPLLARH